MFVQRERQAEAVAIAREAARAYVVGDPQSETTNLGPISNKAQYAKIQDLIGAGCDALGLSLGPLFATCSS